MVYMVHGTKSPAIGANFPQKNFLTRNVAPKKNFRSKISRIDPSGGNFVVKNFSAGNFTARKF